MLSSELFQNSVNLLAQKSNVYLYVTIVQNKRRADFKSTILFLFFVFFPSFNLSDGADNVSVVLVQRCC